MNNNTRSALLIPIVTLKKFHQILRLETIYCEIRSPVVTVPWLEMLQGTALCNTGLTLFEALTFYMQFQIKTVANRLL